MSRRGRALLLLLLLAAGCSLPRPGTGTYTRRGVAPAGAVFCARQLVERLGYAVVADDPGQERFRAVRQLPPEGIDQPASTGTLAVSLEEDERVRELLVVQATRVSRGFAVRRPGQPNPPEGGYPQPLPPTGRDTFPGSGRNNPRPGQVLPPGQVALDAAEVVDRCADGLNPA
ncbi:MAG TPA: hypothetical protein VFX98_07515 [Longimicrobiaceae bacterium]|nr:hypothetical protein [Longimicrobiaceae bacterium]